MFYNLTVRAILPKEESLTVTVSALSDYKTSAVISGGDPSTTLLVPESFHLTVKQNRAYDDEKTVPSAFLGVALVSVLGGRMNFSKEYESSEYALWEADCVVREDSEIEFRLEDPEGQVLLRANSGQAELSGEKASVVDRPEARKRRNLFYLILLIPMSCILLTMLYLSLFGDFSSDGELSAVMPAIRAVFIIMPLLALILIWSRFFGRDKRAESNKKWLDKKKNAIKLISGIRIALFIIFLSVVAGFFVLPALGIDWIYISPFFCTVLLVAGEWFCGNISDRYHIELSKTVRSKKANPQKNSEKKKDVPSVFPDSPVIISYFLTILSLMASMILYNKG